MKRAQTQKKKKHKNPNFGSSRSINSKKLPLIQVSKESNLVKTSKFKSKASNNFLNINQLSPQQNNVNVAVKMRRRSGLKEMLLKVKEVKD